MPNVVGLDHPQMPHGHCLDCGAVVVAVVVGTDYVGSNGLPLDSSWQHGTTISLYGYEEHVCPEPPPIPPHHCLITQSCTICKRVVV